MSRLRPYFSSQPESKMTTKTTNTQPRGGRQCPRNTCLFVGVGEGDVGAQDRAQALLQHRVVLEDAVADEALDELRTGQKVSKGFLPLRGVLTQAAA